MTGMGGKPKMAFICAHNSCRSQMAAAISKKFASDAHDAYAAGVETDKGIGPDAVRAIERLYDVDMTVTQHTKPLSALPEMDIVITMGCGCSASICLAGAARIGGLMTQVGRSEAIFEQRAKAIERTIPDLDGRVLAASL